MWISIEHHRRLRALIKQSGLRTEVVVDRMIDFAERTLLPQPTGANVHAASA